MLTLVVVLGTVWALSGCSSYTGEERDYLDNLAAGGSWVVNSEREEQRALEFGYDVCDQLRAGANVDALLQAHIGSGPAMYARTDAITEAHIYLCPEL